MISRFASRSREVEIMDDLNCSGEVVNQTLRELEIINRLLGGNSITLNGIKKLIKGSSKELITIVDLGCGGGDILKEIAWWGRGQKISFRLIGIDANPHIVDFAKKNCAGFEEIEIITLNIFSDEFKTLQFDIAVATLITHHFSNDEIKKLLSTLHTQVNLGVVINDLHRHWLAYYSIKILTRLFSKSSMVKYDGPLSVLRSFKRIDWKHILDDSNIKNYSIQWKWAFRWQLLVHSSLA